MNDETLNETVQNLIKTMNIVLSRLDDLESLPTNAAELDEAFGENDSDDDWDDWDDEADIDDDEEEDDE